MTSLYLCYQSLLEPLTQTQVVAYLEGLAQAGFRIVLLTFEPRPLSCEEVEVWKARLAAKGIAWEWQRYHKRPTVPATAWDIGAGIIVGLRLVRRHRVRLIHARVHVPGLMALVIKRLTGTKFLFDLRGFMGEEYVDAGVWPPGGLLFRAVKRVERALVRTADAVVILTQKGKDLLEEWYPEEIAGKPVVVIPCCVDFRRLPSGTPREGDCVTPRIVYVGKLGGWYLDEPMIAFFSTVSKMIDAARFDVWTQSDPARLEGLIRDHGLEGRVRIGTRPPETLPHELRRARAAVAFIKPCLSKVGSSPTKIGEYLAAGLPVVSSAGIGDVDDVLLGEGTCSGAPVGVLVREFTPDAYRAAVRELLDLLDDPGLPARCRAVAEQQFDLDQVGWKRYRALYELLLAEFSGRDAPEAVGTNEGERTW